MKATTNYLDFMACVLLADGLVDDGELLLFLEMLRQMGMNQDVEIRYSRILNDPSLLNPKAVIASVARFADKKLLQWIVRDAYLMAESDGQLAKEELALIDELLTAVGISDENREKIHEWGHTLIAHSKTGEALLSDARVG